MLTVRSIPLICIVLFRVKVVFGSVQNSERVDSIPTKISCQEEDNSLIAKVKTYLERSDVGEAFYIFYPYLWTNPETLLHNLASIPCLAKSEEAKLLEIYCNNRALVRVQYDAFPPNLGIPAKFQRCGSLWELATL
ncbi:uncharacterized protein LOC118436837 [Folsomia candida]|uniref:uncharacterized protein LOC118436837 n=1 Tax=Folsomia candida TaxID=158441 RepID=UPI001604D19C|nr:uncharacterized protein LOC118436837 [Folsomia candida]